MYCNFMLMSVNVCREWLEDCDVDWDRVNDKSNIDLVCDEDDSDGHSVLVTVHYEDGNDEAHHTCWKSISCYVSGDFGANSIPLRKFLDAVKKTDESMMLLCTEYGGLGRSVLYDFRPVHRYLLSDIMVESNSSH